MKDSNDKTGAERDQFASMAEENRSGLTREVSGWVRNNRKYWMIPVILSLLLAGAVIVAGGTVAAPLIYALF